MADRKYGITLDGEEYETTVTNNGSGLYNVNINGKDYPVTVRTIALDNIASHIIGLSSTSFIYTGEEIKPDIITDGTVIEDIDYTVTYDNNIDIGTGYATIKALGNTYTGSLTLAFVIKREVKEISEHVTGLSETSFVHTGEAIKPELITDGTVELDVDYLITYENNTDVGTGKVIITGIGTYVDSSVTYEFTITAAPDITAHVTGLENTSYDYTGEQIKPVLVTDGTVAETTDYIVTYGENINLGEGSVTVTGAGTYEGTGVTYTFNIVEAIDSHITGLSETSFAHTGEEIKPELVTDGKVTENTDYTVTYENNIDVGTGKVIVTGINNYRSSVSFEFTITEQTTESETKSSDTTDTFSTDTKTDESTDETVTSDDETVVEKETTTE